MKYDITKSKAPKMPALGRGTECIKLLASQVSKDMREPIIPLFFPVLGSHISNTKFLYPDQSWKEICGMLAHLISDSGMGKGQLTGCIEAIMHNARLPRIHTLLSIT